PWLFLFFYRSADHRDLHSFPTRRSSDLVQRQLWRRVARANDAGYPSEDIGAPVVGQRSDPAHGGDVVEHSLRRRGLRCGDADLRSEEHTSELQSLAYLVCRLLLEKKNNN